MKKIIILLLINISTFSFSQDLHLYANTLILKKDTFSLKNNDINYDLFLYLNDNKLTEICNDKIINSKANFIIKNNEMFITKKNGVKIYIIFKNDKTFKMFYFNEIYLGKYI